LRSWTSLSFDIPSSFYLSNNRTTIGSFLRLDIAHLVINVNTAVTATTTKNLLKMFLCLDERLLFVDKAASLQLALWVVRHQSNDPGPGINCIWSAGKRREERGKRSTTVFSCS
jgi:hypothetical protein